MKNKKLPFAFTLLETLLVVVIIAIMATAGINFYQDYSVDSKITKTAQQMQQILQAAAAYYTDYNCWPGANNCPNGSQPFSTYLSGITKNPWGNAYTYQIEPLFQKKFQVYSGNIPATGSPNNLVARVIGQLANSGIAPQNPNQVLAEITLPKKLMLQQQSNYQLVSILSSAEMSNGQWFGSDFQCPPGWSGAAASVPYYITTYNYDKGQSVFTCIGGSRAFGNLSANAQCSQTNQNPNTYHCNFMTNFSGLIADPNKLCLGEKEEASGTVKFAIFNWCYNSSAASLPKKMLNL